MISENLLNIGSGKGLVPGGTKSLPEPIFTEYLGTHHSAIILNGYHIGIRNIFFFIFPSKPMSYVPSHPIPPTSLLMTQSINPMPNTQH